MDGGHFDELYPTLRPHAALIVPWPPIPTTSSPSSNDRSPPPTRPSLSTRCPPCAASSTGSSTPRSPARCAGQTFAAVAKPLGISRQAAHRRYRHLTAPTAPAQPRLTADARAALIRARAEAARHGSRSIDPHHLLLALAPRGLDVEAARRSFGPPAINAPAPAGLHPTLHARLVRTDGPLQLDHLLRAALEDPASQQLMQRFG